MPSDNLPATQQPAKPMDRFRADLTLREDMIRSLLPKNVTFEKFFSMMVAAVGATPKLLECHRGSLIKSCIQAAELGLSLNPALGECDILPVYDRRENGMVAQFRPRYMGMMKLARQSGEVLKIEAEVIREKDEFFFQKGLEPKLEHRIKLGNRGEMIGAYCVWTLKNGEKQFELMDREQILAIRDRSSAKTRDGKIVGPWMTDEEEMWRKTVVRRASKYMPRSCESFINAVAMDNLREAGHDIEMENGEVIDITSDDGEWGDITEESPKDNGARQVDKVAEKVVAKAPPKAAWKPEILTVPEDDDGLSDWNTWCISAVSVVAELSAPQRALWVKAHKSLLDEAEMVAPGAVEELMEILN